MVILRTYNLHLGVVDGIAPETAYSFSLDFNKPLAFLERVGRPGRIEATSEFVVEDVESILKLNAP